MLILQIVALGALIAYLLYMGYYYIIPTGIWVAMILYARKRYPGIEIRFVERLITVKVPGCEKPINRLISEEIPDRLQEHATVAELRNILRDLRKGKTLS